MGSRMERTRDKAAAGGPGWARQWLADRAVPHLHIGKLGGTIGEQDRLYNPVRRNKIPKSLTENTCGG